MSNIFQEIPNPLDRFPNSYGSVEEGLPAFLSNIFKTLAIAGGLFALFNIITAGIEFISSQGDPKSVEAAQNKIFMSLIGLVIIAASFSLAAITGKLLFGSYSAIISPVLYGPGSP